MKKAKLLIATLFVMGFMSTSYAQYEYKSAVGLRLGSPFSASYKQFLGERGAVEGFVGFRGWPGYSSVSINALYQYHSPIPNVDGLRWYAGGGAGVYFYSWKSNWTGDTGGSTSLGILGVIGLDYKFEDLPINLSIDWMPSFFINGYGEGFSGGYGALGVRYVLK
jgi:hypothetical protein